MMLRNMMLCNMMPRNMLHNKGNPLHDRTADELAD